MGNVSKRQQPDHRADNSRKLHFRNCGLYAFVMICISEFDNSTLSFVVKSVICVFINSISHFKLGLLYDKVISCEWTILSYIGIPGLKKLMTISSGYVRKNILSLIVLLRDMIRIIFSYTDLYMINV